MFASTAFLFRFVGLFGVCFSTSTSTSSTLSSSSSDSIICLAFLTTLRGRGVSISTEETVDAKDILAETDLEDLRESILASEDLLLAKERVYVVWLTSGVEKNTIKTIDILTETRKADFATATVSTTTTNSKR
jgi:hypothetical protein